MASEGLRILEIYGQYWAAKFLVYLEQIRCMLTTKSNQVGP